MGLFAREEGYYYHELIENLLALKKPGKLDSNKVMATIQLAEENFKELNKNEHDINTLYGQIKSHMDTFRNSLSKIGEMLAEIKRKAGPGEDISQLVQSVLGECSQAEASYKNIINYMHELVKDEEELLP